MKPFILPLSDPLADLETVGGKGMSLAKLTRAGLPVPGGFHVTTEAYRYFVAKNELQPGIEAALASVEVSQPQTLEVASKEITMLFQAAPIPDEIATAISQAYGELQSNSLKRQPLAVAVRSSATAEDLPEASFAGQQETYLNISTPEGVLEATRKCWASLWTARAIGYRARQKIGGEGVALAVVVQGLVFSEAAGILFTANPINGQREQMMVSASWGLGEAVVGGLVTPDTLTLQKPSGIVIQRETAQKLIQTVRINGGTEEIPVPENRQNIPVLNDEQAAELCKVGLRIEELYGMPMDIEWTWTSASGFAIVQARPITALPEDTQLPETLIEWTPPDPKGVYMRGSVVDLMPDPLSPLFNSWAIPTLKEQMKPIGKRLTRIQPNLHDDYYTTINNYAYMNGHIPAKAWPWILFGLLPAYPRLLKQLVPLWRDELHPEFKAFVETFDERVPKEMNSISLWQEAQQILDATMYYVCSLMFVTMGASAGAEMLLTKTYNKFAREDDPPATALLMGWNNIPVRSEKSLFDLAMWVRKDNGLSEYLLKTSSQELAEKLQKPEAAPESQWAEFAVRFQQHLDNFGYVVFQLDFAEDLPRDHPEMMLETIKMYLRGEGVNPHARQQASEQKRIQTGEMMLKRLKGLKRWAFTKALNAGQAMAEIREDALAEIGLGYPVLRAMLTELGDRFAAAGAIQNAEDIFWLEKAEVEAGLAHLAANQSLEDLSSRVTARQEYAECLRKEVPPPMIPMKEKVMGIKTETFVAHAADAQSESGLKGVPASPGQVTAPACILHGPEDFDLMHPGDVLVAGATTPAWTPIFAMASAVVTDIGGPLSHGSIVAREYGIPAVMGTGVATRRIQNGQMITVDGSKGEVHFEIAESELPVATPPTEWPVPGKGVTFARGSLAEHIPSPVSPLFATLGLKIANHETYLLWRDYMGVDPTDMFVNKGFYIAINNYVYGGFRMGLKNSWALTKMSMAQIGPMLRGAPERWEEALDQFEHVVTEWEQEEVATLSCSDLLNGASTVFSAAVKYYTVIQTTLPAASMGEIFFTRFYNTLVKRKNDPMATTFLFGFETMPVKAEASLFDIAAWLKENPTLRDYVLQTPTEKLVADLKAQAIPAGIPAGLWAEYREHFKQHFEKFGRTAYEFDFANPTPADEPSPLFEAIKLFIAGKTISPYARIQEAAENREQATQAILNRIGWPRKGWFEKLLKKAQETGGIREDSIFHMGMGHPVIRRIFAELGRRFVASGAIETVDDIYWLEEDEVERLISSLEMGESLPNYADRIPERKAGWQAAWQIIPPVMLPEKSIWQKFIGGGAPEEKDGKTILTGLGTSSGQVTAPACVLYGPEDFIKMKPGDVLVATTTTPAWTPLFALASAVVTDIGGPLSHSSIVAREYGIPAVMAARNATRYIQSGQMVTVDGKAGTVTFSKNGS
ncbi:MAG: PEP/pyruvate-binding domain-containing protein [Anaerolineales bacterium]